MQSDDLATSRNMPLVIAVCIAFAIISGSAAYYYAYTPSHREIGTLKDPSTSGRGGVAHSTSREATQNPATHGR